MEKKGPPTAQGGSSNASDAMEDKTRKAELNGAPRVTEQDHEAGCKEIEVVSWGGKKFPVLIKAASADHLVQNFEQLQKTHPTTWLARECLPAGVSLDRLHPISVAHVMHVAECLSIDFADVKKKEEQMQRDLEEISRTLLETSGAPSSLLLLTALEQLEKCAPGPLPSSAVTSPA